MADSGVLSPSQKRAISALLTARNVRAAAQTAKVSERSLTRWLADPAFQSALHQAEGDALGETVRRLAYVAGLAVDALEKVLSNELAPATVKVQAASTVLGKLGDLRELAQLESRLLALEEAIKAGGTK
jgi:hypothetical protein